MSSFEQDYDKLLMELEDLTKQETPNAKKPKMSETGDNQTMGVATIDKSDTNMAAMEVVLSEPTASQVNSEEVKGEDSQIIEVSAEKAYTGGDNSGGNEAEVKVEEASEDAPSVEANSSKTKADFVDVPEVSANEANAEKDNQYQTSGNEVEEYKDKVEKPSEMVQADEANSPMANADNADAPEVSADKANAKEEKDKEKVEEPSEIDKTDKTESKNANSDKIDAPGISADKSKANKDNRDKTSGNESKGEQDKEKVEKPSEVDTADDEPLMKFKKVQRRKMKTKTTVQRGVMTRAAEAKEIQARALKTESPTNEDSETGGKK